MSASPPDRAESIRHRLRNRVRARGEDVQFALQRYAAERFLYRLGASAHRDRFILKGAMLFAVWGGSLYRSTRDLDFTGYGSADRADVLAAIRDICQTPGPQDELVFDIESLSAEAIRDESEYQGLRIRFAARLQASSIPMQLDIGFGDAIEPGPQEIEYPTLLDQPAPRIRAYPLEAVIAEKFHAMVVIGERNSRYNDFHDVYVAARQFSFSGPLLARAFAATFERRKTSMDGGQPTALTPRFFADPARAAQWRAYLSRKNLSGVTADFDAIGDVIRAFLGPPWSALAVNRSFNGTWPKGGPWEAES